MPRYWLRSTGALSRVETTLFFREPVAIFFSLAFPLILLLFVGSIGGREDIGGGVRFIDAYLASMVGVTAANVGIMGLSIHIADNRGRGALKRYRISPLRPSSFFLAQFFTATTVVAISLVVLTITTLVSYGPARDADWAGLMLLCFLSLYVCASLGVLLGGLPLPVRSVQVVSASVFFIMFFSSGSAMPRDSFPDWLFTITSINPLTLLNESLIWAYTGDGNFNLAALGGLIGFALLCNAIAAISFDWEGRS